MADKEKRLYPGDPGYQGGTFVTRAYVNGRSVEITTKKDPNGNILAVFTRDLFGGLF